MPHYVYILLCKDCSYYTGFAKELKRRVEQRKMRQGTRYTKMHEPEKIVYTEKFASRSEAIKREREIKSFSHSKKHDWQTCTMNKVFFHESSHVDFSNIPIFKKKCGTNFLWTENETFGPDLCKREFFTEIAVNASS